MARGEDQGDQNASRAEAIARDTDSDVAFPLATIKRRGVSIGRVALHVSLGPECLAEAKARIQAMRIACVECEAPESLQLRMFHDALHQRLAITAPAISRQN